MKRKNKTNRMAAFLAAIILIVFGLCQAAFAADANTGNSANIDFRKPIALTITLKYGDNTTAEDKTVGIELYRVGEWDGSQGKYVLTEEFAPAKVDLWENKGQEITEEINALKKCAKEKGSVPIDRKTTEQGKCSFTGLSMGVYMVCENLNEETSENIPAFASYLVSLPLWEENGGNAGYWDYDVEAVSKVGKDSPETPSQPSGDGGNTGNGGGGGGGRRTTIDPEGTPTTTIDDGGTPLDGLNPPPERIEDGDVPLGDGPFQQLIEEVLIPLGLLPKTGDGSISYAPLLALMAASGLLIFGLIWRRVRKTR